MCVYFLMQAHVLTGQHRECVWGVGVAMGSGKGSNHKHLNLQMALMSCAKQPVLTDEPVNPG